MTASWLIRPRPTGLLLLIGLAIGVAHTLTLLPLGIAIGEGPFWEFPRGTVYGSANDFAQVLDGYLHFQLDTWHWPLLQMAHVVPPKGTNLLWLDAVPFVSLLGKLLYNVAGVQLNLLGPYLFACFALPGAAMAAVLVAFEERSLLATLAGATLAVALPFHLEEWGHVALCGQFVVLFAIALYGVSVRVRPQPGIGMFWFGMLTLALLINIYLFVMVGAIWVASLAQRLLNGGTLAGIGIEAAATIGLVVAIMLITGILSPSLGAAGSGGFGDFSLNLGSPFIPQRSGVIPPLAGYLIGSRVQVFGYLGLGVLLTLLVAAITSAGWWWRTFPRHIALLVVLAGCYLFALTYRVTLGSHILLELPVPHSVVFALGVFRSSGRFFWPVGYVLVALAVVTVTERLRPAVAASVLALACVLQLLDINPMRAAIARSAVAPAPPAIDRREAAALEDGVHAIELFPSFGCIVLTGPATAAAIEQNHHLLQSAMEFDLIAARRDLTTNSVDSGRPDPDCDGEAAERMMPLRPGILYVYLDGVVPAAAQFGNADPAKVCHAFGDARACRLPDN